MAYTIVAADCTACGACEFECPNAAIRTRSGTCVIKADQCTECAGHHDQPRCAAVCPTNACIPA